jgi:putative heme transporter
MLPRGDALTEPALPALDVRAAARRLALPAALAVAALAAVFVAGGGAHALGDRLRHGLHVTPEWAVIAAALEAASLAGYIALLSLVAGRATRRIGVRESASITLAGAAATRLLPTAGAGGAALTLWALRRAGLDRRVAGRTLLAFLVVLYSVFLAAIVVSGSMLAFGLARSRGPVELAAIPAVAALLAIALCLALSRRDGDRARPARLRAAAGLLGDAVRDGCRLVRSGDPRLVGAVAYWLFDAAVVWGMLHAFGASGAVTVVALAYFVGQVANTLPLPGSVSGGIAGVLIAFHVPAAPAVAAVLAYRTVAVWLPLPVALAAVPRLRASVSRWTQPVSSS